ncbi:MAG: hypothetical protein QOF71_1125, partial [Candidatus Eremiobacteraeota bacterium]|jgi:capsular polysaccharide biosynthesis protein|nr:hypothetical protein [Candidatus Eremiobacteraeota bacterium]
MKEASAPGPALDPAALAIAPLAVTAAHIPDADPELHATLPRDHPAWQRDILSVSARARAIIAGLRPAVVRVLAFWDHVVRAVVIGRRRLEIDQSGCYRLRR